MAPITRFRQNKLEFENLSLLDYGVSAIGSATALGYTYTNFTTPDRSISATESTAGNIAATLATLVRDLKHRGII